MRILVTGAGGLVGGALAAALVADHDVTGVIRAAPGPAGVPVTRLDLVDATATASLVTAVRPDVVVHAAYGTADLGRDVVAATESVAEAAARASAGLVVLSTDSVFGGDRPPYAEEDRPAPVNAYGRAKLEAEQATLGAVPDAAVVRLALVLHADRDRPDGATRRLVEADRARRPVVVFVDEVRSVVHLDDAVDGLGRVLAQPRSGRAGTWHLGGPRPISRADLATLVAGRLGLDPDLLRPGRAADHPEPRPRNVTLSCRRARRLGWRPRPPDMVSGHGRDRRA